MPVFYKIDTVLKLVLTTGFGFITKEEVITLQDQMSNDPEFDPTFSQLADFSQLRNTNIAMADLQKFAQRDLFSIHARRAIIVQGDIAYGFAKIFELYRRLSGASGIRIFRNPNEAFDWILASDSIITSHTTESARGPSAP